MDAKAEMGIRAKAIYKMLRIRNPLIARSGAILICINQIRDTVGNNMFSGESETSPGGKAMQFFASQRIGLYTKKQITVGTGSNKERIGNEISFRTKKNKVAPPRAPYSTKVIFDPEYGDVGFDKYSGLLDVLLDKEVVTKSGNSIMFEGEQIARGKDHFYEEIEDDKELRADLLEAAEINTLSKTRKLLEGLNTNEYHVGE
jgi:recombination protein RecA